MAKVRFVCPWKSEAEMCDAFMDVAAAHGWAVYPETSGYDILLVATDRVQGGFNPGDQVGVQAKLAPNLDVLHQALPLTSHRPQPNYYAALVPRETDEFKELARRLGIKVLVATRKQYANDFRRRYTWGPCSHMGLLDPPRNWVRTEVTKRLWVPEVQVKMAAGTAGPQLLTPWKMKAVKLSMLGAKKGYLTTVDFAEHDVSMTYWFRKGWIQKKDGEWIQVGKKRLKTYKIVLENNPPHLCYPEVAAALRGATP